MVKRLCSVALLASSIFSAGVRAEPVETKLLALDAIPDDRVGTAVAASGDTVAVGSLWHAHLFERAGAVYVYRRQASGAWIQEAELLASDAVGRENFGRALAMDGDLLVVGSWGAGVSTGGSAYVFRFDGSAWVEEAKLEPPDGIPNMLFGGSVSVDGDVVAVGAQNGTGQETYTGAAYVYRFDGTAWAYEAKLTASDGRSGDAFHEVAVVGTDLLVGAFGVADQEAFEGAAYLFRFDGTEWTELQKIRSPTPVRRGSFGSAVSLTADFALVSDGGSNQAAVFARSPAGLVHDSVVADPQIGRTDRSFSVPTVYTGGVLVAGEGLDRQRGTGAGAAWVFRRDGASWGLDTKILASDGAAADNFGFAIGPSCSSVVIASRGDDLKTGSAYVYTGLLAGLPLLVLEPESVDQQPGSTHRATVAVLDDQDRPMRGCETQLRVLSGPNQGATASCEPASRCVTSSSGQVTFSYPGDGGVGTDEITACVIEQSGRTTCSTPSEVEWLPRSVRVEIAPGSPRNTIAPGSRRLLRVAVFGEADFDAVGSTGLAFGPGLALERFSRPRDLDRDGFVDRIGWFGVHEAGLTKGDVEACVRGQSPAGVVFEGCDAVRVRGRH